MVMSSRDRMKASDAKRLALRKAVLSQWTEQLEIAGEQKCRKADADYFIQAWLACQETLFAVPPVWISAPGDS